MTVIILDTETTGLSHKDDRVVELAGIELDSDRQFARICNPGRGIPPEAMATHHITEDQVKGCPDPFEVHSMFTSHFLLTDSDILVAHNAKFDKGFVNPLIKPLNPMWLCTMKGAQACYPDAPGYSLQVLRYWLGLKMDLPEGLAPHRALYDVICARALLNALLIHKSLDELVELTNRPQILKKVNFGKYKGKLWSQLDRGMLNWVVLNFEDGDEKHTALFYLGRLR